MTALEYSGVVGAGRGFTTVRTPDGRQLTISGTRSTRNNNPGNIEYGPFARSQGAIGSDGRFAVFPNRQAGYKAMEGLVFGGKYANLSLKQAIERYAPPFENNSLAYARAVANRVGVSLATKMRDIPGNLRGAVAQAMANVEGMGRATVKDQQGNVVGKIDPARSPLPESPPLPPQRFQTIASQPVVPDAQAIRTAATLGALPVGGSTRLPAQTFAAPRGEVTRSPLAAIASAINPVSSAQAAPRPNNPTLTPGAMGQGTMSVPSFASARMLAPPTSMPTQRLGAPATPPSLSPKQVAAYQDYANTRGYAPIDPVPARMPSPPTDGFLTSALPVGPAQTLQPQPAQPTFVPTPVQNPVQTPPVPQPPVQTLPKPTQQRIDEAFQTAAPPPTPRFTAADVYAGRAQSGQATGGNTVSRDPFGNISVTNKYGATTTTGPDGRQMAGSPFGGGGIGGPLGPTPPSATTAAPDVPRAPSQFGNTVRGGVGTVLGGGLGGLLAGPIGAALGAVVARDLAVGKNPIDRLGIGTFSVPVTDRFGFTQNMTFANAKSGGPFPDRPTGQAGALGGKDSNRSERSMREISPAATRDIKSGKSGLF